MGLRDISVGAFRSRSSVKKHKVARQFHPGVKRSETRPDPGDSSAARFWPGAPGHLSSMHLSGQGPFAHNTALHPLPLAGRGSVCKACSAKRTRTASTGSAGCSDTICCSLHGSYGWLRPTKASPTSHRLRAPRLGAPGPQRTLAELFQVLLVYSAVDSGEDIQSVLCESCTGSGLDVVSIFTSE